MKIKANGTYYRELNEQVKAFVEKGAKVIHLNQINGQRYIGSGIKQRVRIVIEGVPGNDLAAFMDGPTIVVKSNAQDGVGNTMNSGKVIVHGDAGDVIGYGMRGGRILIKGDVGYRVGIHMKSYRNLNPVIVIGGKARDFLGEYMAGGMIILLGLNDEGAGDITGNYLGTGMHGGSIYLRGEVPQSRLGKEVGVKICDSADYRLIRKHLSEFCRQFAYKLDEVMAKPFIKLVPVSVRPYGRLYAY